jgi:UDP-N-acetyl-D-mannosaminuronic acid transferase (WecB/TagA/CpsF family)
LQIFYAIAVSIGRVSSQRKRLANCNGTDLTLPLLQALPKDAQIHLYGTTTSVIKKAADFLRMQDITPASIADGYSDFDWSQMDIKQKNILLIGR